MALSPSPAFSDNDDDAKQADDDAKQVMEDFSGQSTDGGSGEESPNRVNDAMLKKAINQIDALTKQSKERKERRAARGGQRKREKAKGTRLADQQKNGTNVIAVMRRQLR